MAYIYDFGVVLNLVTLAYTHRLKGVFPLSQPLFFPIEIEVGVLCVATMRWSVIIGEKLYSVRKKICF